MPHCSVGGRLHLGHLMNHFCGNGCKCFIHAVYAKEAFGLEEYAACTAEGPCFHADSRDILVEFFPALPPRHRQDASAARAQLRRASRTAKDDFCCFSPTCHPPVPETDPPVTSPVNQLCHSCPQLSPCHADGDRELSISTNHPSDRCKTLISSKGRVRYLRVAVHFASSEDCLHMII